MLRLRSRAQSDEPSDGVAGWLLRLIFRARRRRGSARHGAAPRDGRRLRHHGRAALRRKRRDRSAREHARHGRGLVALILTFGPISGAHFNPAVTLADATQGGLPWRDVPVYVAAQIVGAFVGVAVRTSCSASRSSPRRSTCARGPAQLVSEFVATFGLLAVIWGCASTAPAAVPFAVGAYITAAYWFTSSTSFANPAVTLARVSEQHVRRDPPRRTPRVRPRAAPRRGGGDGDCSAGSCRALPVVAGRVVDRQEEDVAMKTVLFACVHNAGRSQMAAAWFKSSRTRRRRKRFPRGPSRGSAFIPKSLPR